MQCKIKMIFLYNLSKKTYSSKFLGVKCTTAPCATITRQVNSKIYNIYNKFIKKVIDVIAGEL